MAGLQMQCVRMEGDAQSWLAKGELNVDDAAAAIDDARKGR